MVSVPREHGIKSFTLSLSLLTSIFHPDVSGWWHDKYLLMSFVLKSHHSSTQGGGQEESGETEPTTASPALRVSMFCWIRWHTISVCVASTVSTVSEPSVSSLVNQFPGVLFTYEPCDLAHLYNIYLFPISLGWTIWMSSQSLSADTAVLMPLRNMDQFKAHSVNA